MKKPVYRTCRKCGSSLSTVKYHSHCIRDHVEHLHYVCQTCKYDWTEPTRDSAALRTEDE